MLMDDIDRELVNLLCTKIGMLMEDRSALALTINARSDDEKRAVINELACVSSKIAKLAAAAQSIGD